MRLANVNIKHLVMQKTDDVLCLSRKRSFSAGNLSQNLHGILDIILALSLNGTLAMVCGAV